MRKVTKTTLAIAAIVVGMAFGVKAQEKSVRLDPVSKDLYRLTYLSQGKSDVKVEIIDEEGEILHSEQIKLRNSFTKSFNFQDLQFGEYSVKLTDQEGEYITKINRSEDVYMIATIKPLEEDKAKVIVRGEFMGPVYVNIYDGKRVLVFDDYIDMESSFSKIYDLSRVQASELEIEVVTDSETLAAAKL